MFGINDIPKFFLAFFLVLPVISFLHEAGHVFFAWLMGGKNIKVTVGTGDVLFRLGLLEVRHGEEEVQAAMDEAAIHEMPYLEKRTGYLSMISNGAWP